MLARLAGPRTAPRAEPVSGHMHPSWQPSGAARACALWAIGGSGASVGGGGSAAFASAAWRRHRPTKQASAASRDGSSAPPFAYEQQQQQQQYALGQVMTAQANFVRVRLHRALPPDAELPPLGDRAGEEALLRLWGQGRGEEEAQSAATSSSSSSSPRDAAPRIQGPLLLCTVRGILKKLGQPVLVGDRVVVSTTAAAVASAAGGGSSSSSSPTPPKTTAADRGVVARVLPASRPPLRDPPVANADHVVLLLSLAQPPFEPLAASRFLVSVAAVGLPVTVALNKCDLVGPEEAGRRAAQVKAWGYAQPGQVVCVSCETGEGLAALARRLGGGRTSVVAGPSGAGKSSLINALLARSGGGRGGNGGGAGFESAYMVDGHVDEDDDDDDDGLLFGGGGEEVDEEDDGRNENDDDDPDDLFGRCSGGGGDDEGGDDDGDDLFGMGGGGDSDSAAAAAPTTTTPAPLAVGAVSARSGRGRHTTRTVTLVPIPAAVVGDDGDAPEDGGEGGLLADTPGFSMPSLDGVPSAALGALFPDFAAAQEGAAATANQAAPLSSSSSSDPSASGSSGSSSSTGCRFTDCLHVAEPGCAVLAAVEAALDAADAAAAAANAGADAGGAAASPSSSSSSSSPAAAYVDPERLEHYYRFLSEAKAREAEDVRAMQEAKRRREGATKAVVGRGGQVRQEARLDGRKHRAVSRRSGKQEAMRAMLSDEEDDGLGRDGGGGGGGGDDEDGGRPRKGSGGGGGGRGRRSKTR